MVLVDGKKIAADIAAAVKARVAVLQTPVRLAVFACNPNFETQKYLALKKAKAEGLGISLTVHLLPEEFDTKAFVVAIEAELSQVEGIIVQLPLPSHIDTALVLAAVPASQDVDAFAYTRLPGTVLPPVVGAIDEISKAYQVEWLAKKVVIFGEGRLVGAPALEYAKQRSAQVIVVNEFTQNVEAVTKIADIIIMGVGRSNLLTLDMVKEGVVVFDAGASEDGGLLVGDANPEVASKASLFTPVPGGIGPLTVALLFRNLLELQARQ